MSEQGRQVWAAPMAVCVSGKHAQLIDESTLTWQIRCPNGHWTWEDGNFCVRCGTRLRSPSGTVEDEG